MVSRKFSTGEFLTFMTVIAVVCSVWFVDKPNALLAVPAMILPGALIAGPIGFLIGGRKWFVPAALVGSAIWFILILIPAVNVST
jgi:uncharacterized membrane protein YczE